MSFDGGSQEPFSLQSLVAIVSRRKVAILLLVLLTVAAVVGISLTGPKVYEAQAEVYLSSQDIGAILTGTPSNASDAGDDRKNQTQAQLARVPDIAAAVVGETGVTGLTASQLLDDSSVEARTNSDILVFKVWRESDTEAVVLAGAYAKAFIAYRHDLDTRALVDARKGVETQLSDLRAQGDESSSLYADLFSKRQQLATLETLQTSNAYVVREPDDAAQIAPRPVRAGVIALIAAVLIGLLGALMWEALDSRVRTAGEVTAGLGGIALLARLPKVKSGRHSERRLIVRSAPASAEAEPYRILRASLDFATMGRGYGSILITSAGPGEGKTTTAANLAMVLAQGGMRVCLVDLDLRRPSVHRVFGLPAAPGFTDLAVGRVAVMDALVEIPTTAGKQATIARGPAHDVSLWVMPAGTTPPNPGEFVGTPEVGDLLKMLGERFDAVIVDAPPFLAVVDARVLATTVSGILIVARPTLLKRPALNEFARALGEVKSKVLGVVTIAEAGAAQYGYASEYSQTT